MSLGGLADDLIDAGRRTQALAEAFANTGTSVPQIAIVNPPLWECGHIGWFAEHWVLRHALEREAMHAEFDHLFDSASVAHGKRWVLPLPRWEDVQRYSTTVRERVCAVLGEARDARLRYFATLACFHEDMHGEATLMTLQTLRRRWPLPLEGEPGDVGGLGGDVEIPGGRYRLGAEPHDASVFDTKTFVFDNEKWAHEVDVAAFRMARAPVTNAEYLQYVAAGGALPRDWVRAEGETMRRRFDELVPLRPNAPVVNVSRCEAEAYCAWAGRRLPTEAEWEIAAAYDFRSGEKHRFPWGDSAPSPLQANLDARLREPLDVAALPAGDTPSGLRQMIGNVWEWTATPFAPYPGFVLDPYKEYSAPWFGDHAVLRGGAWTTQSRLIRATWRNFYRPERSDPFAGFRTVALR
ncbi:MAG: SUMF1/EgtB/PvdO family nonheme iron enzyme [Candidatus Eremiobacteraeota bacterium]|nr:SUMF1/EgtB/PvdO family nonheme iron enzyme [Candidatus Eremiobacteraeota bacterium]